MTQVIESPATAGTATTAGARAHAREQHGRTVDTMRFVPAASAPARLTAGLPEEATANLTWAESVAFGRYTALILARGTRIRLTDAAGDACVHTLLYRDGALHERLNIADTVKVPWQAYPAAGHPLVSDAGRLMATIVTDSSSRHDALTGATTLEGNTARYGAGTAHSASPAARELLTLGALKTGLGPRDVAPSLSLFKGINVDPAGSITFTGSAGPGAAVELLLQMDAVLVLANTAHPLDPRANFTGTAVDIVAWHAPQDLAALEAGTLTGPLAPEHLQALHNTEHDLTARNAR
jgi:urea carboxylase-associated protein 2